MKYRSYGKLDDAIQPEGDNAFMGFSSRVAKENLKPGFASLLCNMRLDKGQAQVREGIRVHNASINLPNTPLHLQFNLDTAASGNQPLLGGTNGVMIPTLILDNNGVEWVAMVTTNSLVFWNQDSTTYPVVSLPYPAGEEVLPDDEPFVMQAGTGSAGKLIVFRGFNKDPLILDNVVNSSTTISASTAIPNSVMGLWFLSRLYVIQDDYTIAYSNTDACDTFITGGTPNEVTIGYGGHDPIRAIAPFGEGQLIVFKRNSIHVITNANQLGVLDGNGQPFSRVLEVTRQHGVAGRRTVTAIGDQVFYLSDAGVYSLTSGINAQPGTATPVQLMKVINDPISSPIQDQFDQVNMSAAISCATGIFYDNRFFLAVPWGNDTSGNPQIRNNRVLVYSLLTKSWESIDYFGDGTLDLYFDEFMVGGFGSKRVLFMGNKEAYIFVYGEGEQDRWGRDGSEGNLDIQGKLHTRGYSLGTVDVKNWRWGQIHWAHADPATPGVSFVGRASNTLDYSISTVDTNTVLETRTISSPYDDGSTRFSLGRIRGVHASAELSTSGRFKINRVELSGRQADGQLHEHI